jgi:uncharacterized protein YbjT (DUF2867 family)
MTTVLITGATGRIGRLLVDDLLRRGATVRALSRDPSTAALPAAVRVSPGDLANAPDDAFDGVHAAFVFPAAGADAFMERAVSAGVERFVVLSSLAVSGRSARDVGSASARHHRAVEEAVTSRTDEWTVLRPGAFASNLLSWAFPIRAGMPVRVPYPTSAQVLVHEADVAVVAAIALVEEGHARRVHELTGPDSLTRIEQLATIAAAVGHDVPWVEIGPEAFREDVAPYLPGDLIDMLLAYWSETVDEPEEPLPPVLGLPRTPLSRWAVDHREAFGG